MIKYVSVDEMIAVEKEADASGLTYELMMENAGKGLAQVVYTSYSQNKGGGVLGLVGSGNNGGDTLVALAWLAEWGWRVSAYIVRARPPDDALVKRFEKTGGTMVMGDADLQFQEMRELIHSHEILLDGVLGTGIRLPLKSGVAEALDAARKALQENEEVHVVAVDCPSGIDCDTGEAAPECIPAEMTVSMAAAKRGLLKFPAYSFLGELRFVGIGLGGDRPFPKTWESLKRFVVDDEWLRIAMPKRPLDAHKGTFGTSLIVAGSVNYTGAALLAGEAAYRVGAGLVTLAVPQSLHTALSGQFPEATWLLLPEKEGGIAENAAEILLNHLERVTSVLIGPGFGLRETTRGFVEALLARGKNNRLPPIVFDADGLKLLASLPDWPTFLPAPAGLTPHPGEMAVLTGLSIQSIQPRRLEVAEEYAHRWGHVVVLKGAFTVVAAPDGRTGVIPVASPALARAGTGDVLAGLICGLRAQGMDAFQSAAAGAWIHAQAGLRAARLLKSTAAVLAGDVLTGVIGVMGEVSE